MPCEQYREKIQLFVDGMLSDEETAALREHCMHCRSCAVYLREMDALQRAVQALGGEPVPQDLHAGIMAAYREEKRVQKREEEHSEPREVKPIPEAKAEPEEKRVIRYPETREARRPETREARPAEKREAKRGEIRWLRPLAAAAAVVLLVGVVFGADAIRRRRNLNVVPDDQTVDIGDEPVPQGSFTSSAKPPTTAAATSAATTGSASTAATTAAPPATTAGTTAGTTAPTAPTMDPEVLKRAREEAEEMIPTEPEVTEPYGFVHVVRSEIIPQEYREWEAVNIRYRGEKVKCAYAVLSAKRIEEVLKATEADWEYTCDDPAVWDALTPDCGDGLLLMIVPEGT